jgi:hypothetical protein
VDRKSWNYRNYRNDGDSDHHHGRGDISRPFPLVNLKARVLLVIK